MLSQRFQRGCDLSRLAERHSIVVAGHVEALVIVDAVEEVDPSGLVIDNRRRVVHGVLARVGDTLRGRPRAAAVLTAREQDVLELVAQGATNKEIAQDLNVSIHTVKSHMRKILAKLHLEKRQEAVLYAKREGLINPPPDPSSK